MIVWTITRVTESFVPVSAVSFTIRVGTPGVGVPPGGATGTVLRKASTDDYDTQWGGVTAASITDSTATGRAVLTATDAAAARSAIGAGVGDALTSGTLGQFAATTSAQLAGVLTDETGSGAAVFGTSPTLSGVTLGGTTSVTGGLLDLASVANPWPMPPSQAGLRRFGNFTEIWNNNSFAALRAGACWIIGSTMRFGWSPDSTSGAQFGVTAEDTALSRNAAGVVEINNGTAGTLRDLTLRNLTASGTVLANTITTTQNGFDLILKPITGATSHGVIIQAQGGAEVMRGTGSGNPRMLVGYTNTYGEDPSGAKLQAYANSNTSIPFVACNWLNHTADTISLAGVSSTNARRPQAAVNSGWADSTDATRTAQLTLTAYRVASPQVGVTVSATAGGTATVALSSSLTASSTGVAITGLTTLGTYTVGTLPSASANAGAMAQVTDSNTTTNGSIVAGGGANRVTVFSDGTNWRVGHGRTGNLGQFDATTSDQLASVLTDETGSGGGFVRATGPTITTPAISGTLSIYQTGQSGASTARVDVSHDGTDTIINSLSGRIRLSGGSSQGVVIQGAGGTVGGILLLNSTNGALTVWNGWPLSHTVSGRFGVQNSTVIGWSSTLDASAAADTALARNAAGVVEINNGTAGTLRDLTLRNLTASGQLVGTSGFTGGLELRGGGTSTNRVEANGFALFGLSGSTIQSAMNRGNSSSFSVLSTGGFVWGTTTSAEGPSANATAGIFRPSASTLEITNGRPTSGGGTLGNLNVALVNVGTYTVGTLPSASANAGALAQVTDSSVTTNGSAVAGGGANRVVVFSNGTTWDVVVA